MLGRLFISNIVLIENLDVEFGRGLNVLTGETGAGKSILLDALALVLGARTDVGLIRAGCETANVIAEISDFGFLVSDLLTEQGIEAKNEIVLRRTLSKDGKSRAFINDIPVSLKTLKSVGDLLVEIHGQFENHTLLDATTHIKSLDDFGDYGELLSRVRESYTQLNSLQKKLRELNELLERSALEREFLEHNVRELSALKPQIGEEEDLSNRRASMMDMEKNSAILNDASSAIYGLDEKIFNVAHILERVKTLPNPYAEQINSLYEVAENIGEVASKITPIETDSGTLESVEERLFALRAAARKHRVSPDELAQKLTVMSEQLDAIDNSDVALSKTKSELVKKRNEFDLLARELTDARKNTAEKLRSAILNELPDLKLASADFMVEITPDGPNANGADNVIFMIKTNPGSPFAPLNKIASGGELARLMLAMRVILMSDSKNKTFIFDEIDTGISGGTASAVGGRLARLSENGQSIVITHSAQVAGHADKHFLISKSSDKDSTKTSVCEISGNERLNEIARIISGAKITPESMATAKTLLRD